MKFYPIFPLIGTQGANAAAGKGGWLERREDWLTGLGEGETRGLLSGPVRRNSTSHLEKGHRVSLR